MAEDLGGLPDDWLNDAVKAFLPDQVVPTSGDPLFAAPGIAVAVAAPDYLFAMKASAARSEADRDDLRTLLAVLGITSVDEAFNVLERHYSRRLLTPKSQFALQEIIAEYLTERTER